MSRPSMLRGVMSFSGMTMLSRVFGLIRDWSINYVFGASGVTDAFWVANRIPNFMRRLFAEGSFSTAFVPVFTEIKETRPHADLKEMVALTAGTLGGILLVIVALGVIFAPQVTAIFSPGALDEPAKFNLTVNLLRLTFPFILFVSLTALSGGALNSFHRFGLPALTPVIMNLCMIAGALWLSPHLKVPIMALGWAIFLAGILQLLFQLPALRSLDLLSWPRWGWHNPDVRKVMQLMLPTLFGSSIAQINLLLDTVIASLLIAGSQSWLSQADRFLELPLGVFGVALGTVILPSLSRHHVTTDREGFSNALDWGLRTTLLICVPAMLALMLLAIPLVSTMFQYGKFTYFDTRMAALSVTGLSFGLPAFALVKVLLPAFYSRQDTKTPVRAGVASLIANMALNFLFLALLFWMWAPPEIKQLPWLEGIQKIAGLHLALGLASALASYLNLALLWRWLRRDGVYRPAQGWAKFTVRLLASCAAMVAVILVGLHMGPDWSVATAAIRALALASVVVGGGLAYVGAQFALGFRIADLRGV